MKFAYTRGPNGTWDALYRDLLFARYGLFCHLLYATKRAGTRHDNQP